jgi:CO/xanthine dehydrogenase Mo-binding subunit
VSGDRIGTSARRVGGYERVTGQQEFVGDIRLDDMLHVKLNTIDCAHARIHRIDTERARALPGVRDVVCAADLPDPMPRFGPVYQDRPVLAAGQTRFHGEPVAAVVAESEQLAEEAAALVEVHYSELPAVTTVAGGGQSGAGLARPGNQRGGLRRRLRLTGHGAVVHMAGGSVDADRLAF